jgi:hypothetical protein
LIIAPTRTAEAGNLLAVGSDKPKEIARCDIIKAGALGDAILLKGSRQPHFRLTTE